ncbi:MAG: MGMT family protein [Chloroflexota bacterium]|nr:MGMT family protein [Chloroflexota bacterium]
MEGEVFRRVHQVVARIPRGCVVTYGQIAQRLGMLHGARTVGWAMSECPDHLPWHRVVNAQGRISARAHPFGTSLQRALLEDEGVVFDDEGCIEMARFRRDGI